MKKGRSKILLAALLVIGALAALWPTLMTLLFQSALSSARASGLRVAWQGVSASYLSAQADLLEVWVPGPPLEVPIASRRVSLPGPAIKLELNNITISVDPLSLLQLSPKINAQAFLYGGSLSVSLNQLLSDHLGGEIHLQGASLEKHPQLRGLGLGGGTLALNASGLSFSRVSQALTSGKFSFELSKLTLPSRQELALLLKSESLVIDLLSTSAELTNGTISVAPFELATSFGTAKGRAGITLPTANRPFRFDGTAGLSLTQNGLATLGQWLPLLSNQVLNADDRNFEVKGASAACSDRTVELPIGCVRVVFSRKDGP